MIWFGKKGEAFFDGWSVVHLAFWAVIGANLQSLSAAWWLRLVVLLGGAFAWEIAETQLEKHTTLIKVQESMINRWVSDPLMAIVGGIIGALLVR